MLTISTGIKVLGSNGTVGNWNGNGVIVNQGTISADDSGGASSFAYDSGFSGGGTGNTSDAIDTSGVSNAAPAVVYQTYRYGGSFTYALTNLTSLASYTVRLHFAEPSYNNARQRQFNVRINNALVLVNFDIVGEAGSRDKAVVKAFPATADATGQITLNFTQGAIDCPLVNGIEVLTGSTVVQAINCGELAGGTLTVNPVTWSNSGTLGVVNGSSLNLSGSWSTSTPLSVSAWDDQCQRLLDEQQRSDRDSQRPGRAQYPRHVEQCRCHAESCWRRGHQPARHDSGRQRDQRRRHAAMRTGGCSGLRHLWEPTWIWQSTTACL